MNPLKVLFSFSLLAFFGLAVVYAQPTDTPEVNTIISIGSAVDLVDWGSQESLLAVLPRFSKTVDIISISDGNIVYSLNSELPGLGRPVLMAWDPAGSQIASLETTYDIRVWDVNAQQVVGLTNIREVYPKSYDGLLSSLNWSPDNVHVAIGINNDLFLLDTVTLELNAITPGDVAGISWSPDGDQIAIVGAFGDIIIFSAETLMQVAEFQLVELATSGPTLPIQGNQYLAWSPDGENLALFFHQTENDYVIVKKVSTGDTIAVFEGHKSEIQAIAWHPDGELLVSGGGSVQSENDSDNIIRIWDITTGEQLFALDGHTELVSSLSWSPNGTQLASGSWDGTIRIWDIPQAE